MTPAEAFFSNIGEIITSCGMIFVAWMQIRADKSRKHELKKTETRTMQVELSISLSYANSKLCDAIANVVKANHGSEGFENELKEVHKVIDRYDKMMRELVAESIK